MLQINNKICTIIIIILLLFLSYELDERCYMEPNSAITPEFRARVIEAAEQLYAESGRERMPSASEVRAIARTDMNLTTIVVREWKRQQTARPVPVAVSVPESVQQAMSEALASVWTTAQELANASLRSAEQQWQIEREEIAADLKEVSGEVERLEGECKTATERCNVATLNLGDALERIEQQDGELRALREQLARQEALTQQAEARTQEIERRAEDLKGELAIAHEDAAAVRNELSEARRLHLAELDQVKNVAAEQIERTNEQLATVRGRLDAANEQLEARGLEVQGLQTQLATATAQAEAAVQIHAEQKQGAAREAHRLAERFTTLQSERDEAVRLANQANQDAARLSGQLESLQDVLSRLAPAKTSKKE
ncbi:DNA-binding protein [Pseudomonas peli]|nr:DNA-binding protein [Pseudomonas peli]